MIIASSGFKVFLLLLSLGISVLMTKMSPNTPDDIIHFWDKNEEKWFIKDPLFDEEIKKNFSAVYESARSGQLNTWEHKPESLLALVIVLDQFPRNMFRETPKAFESDELALRLTKKGLFLEFDKSLTKTHKQFLYMPLMHSEALLDQDLSVTLFSNLNDSNSLIYAKKHRDIIARFGRFPHRNKILGRASTPEELLFLTQPGSSF